MTVPDLQPPGHRPDYRHLEKVFACIMGDDLAHSHGMPFGLHSCGNNTALREERINVIGIDAKHFFKVGVESVVDFTWRCGGSV